jgi:4'-phosphopantetheinyl transferase
MKEVTSIEQPQKKETSEQYVQVYALSYLPELNAPSAKRLRSYLPENERARYDCIPAWSKRLEFVVSRSFLRRILGIALKQVPSQLSFVTTEYGKPELHHPGTTQPAIFFNLSHTEGYMTLAVTRYGEVGIDVEMLASYQDRIARRFFHPDEYTWLQQLERAQQAPAFYRIWTIKEACVKALGYGLQFPLREIRTVPETAGQCLNLWWQALDLWPETRGAIAVRLKGDVPFIRPKIASIVYLNQEWLYSMEDHQ